MSKNYINTLHISLNYISYSRFETVICFIGSSYYNHNHEKPYLKFKTVKVSKEGEFCFSGTPKTNF